jgi:hypothetical protein
MATKQVVNVLGCGPAGLMSAHAAVLLGYEVRIHSKKRKSEMYGAQYLHQPIPHISEDADRFEVNYELAGTQEGYREKVYGKTWNGLVSPDELLGKHDGWDIRAAYDRLWRRYSPLVIDVDFKSGSEIRSYIDNHDITDVWVSSIPATALCQAKEMHAFNGQEVWAVGDAPERGVFSPVRVAEQTVICNGEDSPGWYRASMIQGYATAEWSQERKPPLDNVVRITKPLSTTCTCLSEVHRVGRYGMWQKGVLSHTAFTATWNGLGGEEMTP